VDVETFVSSHNITMTVAHHGLQTDDDGWAHNRYTVRLKHAGRTLTTSYRTGTGLPLLTNSSADVAQVLDALRSDAQCYADARDFADFCADFGYDTDTDSRKAHAIYRACGNTGRRLERVLGADLYLTLLDDVDPL
jgi:hypothetical protein